MGRPGEVKLRVLRARMPELFPALLRRLRNARGLLAKDIAEVLGTSLSEVKRLEEGYRLPPPHERLDKIARRMNLATAERIELFTAAAIDRGNIDVDGLAPEDVSQLVQLADLMRATKKAPKDGGPRGPAE